MMMAIEPRPNVGPASYDTVPELVRLLAGSARSDWKAYALIASIEGSCSIPDNPDELAGGYRHAWKTIVPTVLDHLITASDDAKRRPQRPMLSGADGALWMKALHVTAVPIFIGALFVQAIGVAAGACGTAETVSRVSRWDQCVSLPTMLAIWFTGALVAASGAWFATTGMGKARLRRGIERPSRLPSGRLRR